MEELTQVCKIKYMYDRSSIIIVFCFAGESSSIQLEDPGSQPPDVTVVRRGMM